ncbi:MAG: YgjV family protein [Patescibacteria group bacterium]
MDIHQLLIQSIALVALGLFAFSFHTKTRRSILFFQLMSLIVYCVHFYFLSAWTGVVLVGLHVIITLLLLFKEKYRWIASKYFLVLSIGAMTIATLYVWEGFFSLFALFGISSIVYAKWQSDLNVLRKISVIASIFAILYDAFVGSYGGILAETVIIISIIFSMLNRDNKNSLHLNE